MAPRPPEGDGGLRSTIADDASRLPAPVVGPSEPPSGSTLRRPPPRRRPRGVSGRIDRFLEASPESWVTAGIVVACVVFTAIQLQPSLILRDTLPNGGDMGAHVWAPAYLRDHLLPQWQLTGWTPDWYAGFPALRFYMVPPMLAVVALDLVLPYGIAFKIVTVSGVLTLPVASWAFGRLAGLRFPGPALFAVAAVLFLFERDFSIYGGNIASTLAGEFAFSISLSLAVLYLGFVANGLRTGRYRALAAATLALCGLTHVIPLFFAVVGTFVLFVMHLSRRGVHWLLTTAPVGALLAAWWMLPFVWQRAHLNDMGWRKVVAPEDAGRWERLGFWATFVLPDEHRWAVDLPRLGADLRLDIALLVVAAAYVLVAGRQRIGTFLVAMLVVGAYAVVLVPQGRLWNARLTPFTHLLAYCIVALALALLSRQLAQWLPRDARSATRIGVAVAGTAAALFVVAIPLRALPFFGEVNEDGSYEWLWIETTDSSFVPGWARWNYRGYQGKGENWREYEDVVLTMGNLGERRGCGRAMWEYSPDLDRYGTPMALMLLPYWTDGCIGSMEGLYFESAATTPFHFLNQSALSTEPSRAQRGVPYGDFDIELGVRQLQLLGVSYYMAQSEQAIDAASGHAALTEVERSGPWVIYEVEGAPLVESLESEPVVLAPPEDPEGGVLSRFADLVGRATNRPDVSNEEWLESTAPWFQAPDRWDVHVAADGPEEWTRIPAEEGLAELPARALEPVEITDVRRGEDWISFDVSEVGVPVLVKESYFPNWEASGAEGPWRVSPNFMVVVPTDTRVELTYGTAPVELAGWGLTALGSVGLAALVLAGPLRDRRPRRGAHSTAVATASGIVDRPSHRAPAPGERRMSIVVPAYREATVIGDTITRLRQELERVAPDAEIVVVDDGSGDGTAERARAAGADQVVELRRNRGKGAAVRAGVAVATGRTIAFTDADLAYSPDQVVAMVRMVEDGWDLAVGSRHTEGAVAEVETSVLRRVGGWVVNRLARLVVGDQADTQCGVKAFRSDVADLLFDDSRIDGFGFDVEIFALARWHALSLRAVPVRVVNSPRSTVRVVRDGLTLGADLLRIAWWLRHDAYTPPADAGLPPAGSATVEH